MPKPKFVKGAVTLQFSVYFTYPETPGLDSGQRLIKTNGGGLRVQNVRNSYRELIINITNMSQVEFDELEAFCENTINWMVENFTYTDHLGSSLTVRLMTPNLKDTFSVNYLDNVSGSLQLRVE